MKLKLGVIGLSEGNGHPYSWSAIFNGFDNSIPCPYSVIPTYLNAEKYPNNFLGELAEVTHIWTQDAEISKQVAKFANIKHIVTNADEMIGKVDAILLARDDADNHLEMAKPFIEKGIPIFIDKPLSFTLSNANAIYNLKKDKNQLIYTCSSIRFAKEFDYTFNKDDYNFVEATIMKDWNKYAVHIIEPVVRMFPKRGSLKNVKTLYKDTNIKIVFVEWQNLTATFKVLGDNSAPLKIKLFGKKGIKELVFKDTFFAFKSSLKNFVDLVNGHTENIPKSETLEIIEIIEKGNQ